MFRGRKDHGSAVVKDTEPREESAKKEFSVALIQERGVLEYSDQRLEFLYVFNRGY